MSITSAGPSFGFEPSKRHFIIVALLAILAVAAVVSVAAFAQSATTTATSTSSSTSSGTGTHTCPNMGSQSSPTSDGST